MNEDKFLMHQQFSRPLDKHEFVKTKKEYLNYITEFPYKIKDEKDIFELIQNIKRSPEEIGPYRKISVFEALNRIGSDLVLLSGATGLFNGVIKGIDPERIQLRMGTTRGFDFEVHLKDGVVIYGEAFNAAKSFCNEKMRQAIHKLLDDNPDKSAKLAIVFVNEEVKDRIENYLKENHKLKANPEFKIHLIYCKTKIN